MSLRREVSIRIIALLQKKTLIETKNCTLKCLKRHYSTMRSMKNVAVCTEDGAFALFFRPHPGGFDSSRVPTPGNLPSKAKKVPVPGGQPRWALGTAGIDACIKNKLCKLYRYVLSHQVGFLCLFGLKTGIDFAHFGLELGMVFEGTTGRYEHIYCFSSR